MVTRAAEFPGMISLIGVKTPGLTCANWLGEYVTQQLLPRLGDPKPNPKFDPRRKPPLKMAELSGEEQRSAIAHDPAYGRVVCRCRTVTEGEIVDAIHRLPGAVTVDGVKYRTGTCMGRCQGSFCTQRIIEILARELGKSPEEIQKGRPGSWLLGKESGDETV